MQVSSEIGLATLPQSTNDKKDLLLFFEHFMVSCRAATDNLVVYESLFFGLVKLL